MTNQGNDQRPGIMLAYFLICGLATGVCVIATISFSSPKVDNTAAAILSLGLIGFMVPFIVYIISKKIDSVSSGGTSSPEDGSAPGQFSEQQDMMVMLRSINERMMYSERAKQVSYRAKDRALMRQAIEEDIANKEYDAALILIDQMANLYGYRAEAEQFRQQVIAAQQNYVKEMLAGASQMIDDICKTGDFDRAQAEVERLTRLYPNAPQIKRLPLVVDKARNNRKRELEREFMRAADIGDNDRAMALMKEMDRYLTPEEAEPYLEIARGVIGQQKENLALQFRMRVSDHDWIGAYQIGEQIIREFPNSKFSDEVRKMLDQIRSNAAQQQMLIQQQLHAQAQAAQAQNTKS